MGSVPEPSAQFSANQSDHIEGVNMVRVSFESFFIFVRTKTDIDF